MKEKEATFFLLLSLIIMRVIKESRNVVEEDIKGNWKDRFSQFKKYFKISF